MPSVAEMRLLPIVRDLSRRHLAFGLYCTASRVRVVHANDKNFTDQPFRRPATSGTRLCVLVWVFPFLSTGKIMPAGTTNSVAAFERRTQRFRDRDRKGLGESRDLQH
jgi:hypothetical protein